MTGVADWPVQKLRVADLAGIDRGMAVCLRDDWAQLMPHGGVRVVHRVIEQLAAWGVDVSTSRSGGQTYPEADSELEADMLACLADATSPAAIDLLLAQPAVWRRWLRHPRKHPRPDPQADVRAILDRSDRLDRLVHPASVVVVGRPNVGKSTLSNLMLGRTASMVADLPGTTRDWVAGLADLSPGMDRPLHAGGSGDSGVTVRWTDTPGLRASDDPIEANAIELATAVIGSADVLIALRDPATGWPTLDHYQRQPDLWVLNKIDTLGAEEAADTLAAAEASRDTPLGISAASGQGVDRLGRHILHALGLGDGFVDDSIPWAFCDALRDWLSTGRFEKIDRYARAKQPPDGMA